MRKRNSAFALMLALLVIFPAGAAETKAGLPIPQIYYPPSSPRLLAASLRYENITDNEVRQIQAAMPARWRGNIVNISGVIDGCFCESSTACSAQVAVLAQSTRPSALAKKEELQASLIFSRVNGKWDIASLQKWWLDYEWLGEVCASSRVRGDASLAKACGERQQKMLVAAPVCQ